MHKLKHLLSGLVGWTPGKLLLSLLGIAGGLLLCLIITSTPVHAQAQGATIAQGAPCKHAPLFTCYTDAEMTQRAQAVKNVQSPIGPFAFFIFYTSHELTLENDVVHYFWNGMVGLVDAFVIVVVIIEGILLMGGASFLNKAIWIESIPRLILAVIALHLSFSICAFFITLNNSLSFGMFEMAKDFGGFGQAKLENEQVCTKHKEWWQFWRDDCVEHKEIDSGDILNGNTSDLNFDEHFLSINDAVSAPDKFWDFLIQIFSLILFGQGVTRLFLIILYMAFAPIGIGSLAFPGKSGLPITKLWLHGFASLCIVQFLQTVTILVTGIMLGSMTEFMRLQVGGQATDANIARIMRLTVIFLIIRIPGLLQTGPLQMMVASGQMIGQTASAVMNLQLANVTTEHSLDIAEKSNWIAAITSAVQIGTLFIR